MNTVKAFILVVVILAVIVFVVYGIRAIKSNEKKNFGDHTADNTVYSFSDIIKSITNTNQS